MIDTEPAPWPYVVAVCAVLLVLIVLAAVSSHD